VREGQRQRQGGRGGEEMGDLMQPVSFGDGRQVSSKTSVRANATSPPAGNYPVATATAIKSCKGIKRCALQFRNIPLSGCRCRCHCGQLHTHRPSTTPPTTLETEARRTLSPICRMTWGPPAKLPCHFFFSTRGLEARPAAHNAVFLRPRASHGMGRASTRNPCQPVAGPFLLERLSVLNSACLLA
jgi:hypothetical protein